MIEVVRVLGLMSFIINIIIIIIIIVTVVFLLLFFSGGLGGVKCVGLF